ncbi:hypothetical protein BGZ49_006493, partial [Haplosporangium sp. Z 27]
FLPVIQHNSYWRRELCYMFQQVKGLGPAKDVGFGNAFEVLAKKKLLKPSRAVQQKIDSVMNRIPKNVTLIGLQGRKTENNAVGKGIKDSFLSCAASVVKEEEAKAQGQGQGSDWDFEIGDSKKIPTLLKMDIFSILQFQQQEEG